MTASPWTPLDDARWQGPAREALADIAAAVGAHAPEHGGLASGASGAALFLSYYSSATDDADAEARATELLESALEQLASGGGAALFSGAAGIAWAVEHLAGTDPDDDDDPLAGVDDALGRLAHKSPWSGPYDLVGGLCGLAVYFLERLPRPAAARGIEAIVAHLEALSEPATPGRTWHTPAAHLPEWQRELAPTGYYNLGMAHGVPAIVGILARILEAGVASDPARRLLAEAAPWLAAQQVGDEGARYPGWIAGSTPTEPSRTAWCYGDPGVACALFSAGRAAGEPDWEREGIRLALGAARRPQPESGVVDAGLCHGALGLAHIFLRFHAVSGIDEFQQAAGQWIERGLALRRPGEGVAGFFAARPDGPVAEAGFLEGAAGIGLALLAATTDLEPDWDRLLLTDL